MIGPFPCFRAKQEVLPSRVSRVNFKNRERFSETFNSRAHSHVQKRNSRSLAARRVCSAEFNPGSARPAADLAIVMVGGRRFGTLSEAGETRPENHRMARSRSDPVNGRSVMTIQQTTREVRTIGKLTALLPSEARDTNILKVLARYLGNFYLIVIQLVLATFPKLPSGAVTRQ
jgi:hypothetical protein